MNTNQGPSNEQLLATLAQQQAEFQRQQAETNQRIFTLLENATRVPVTEPKPLNVTAEEFQDSPTAAIAKVVEHVVSPLFSKLRDDMQSQVKPVNDFIAQSQRNQALDRIVAAGKSMGFVELNDTMVEAAFREACASLQVIDQNSMRVAYLTAVGAVKTGSYNNPNVARTPVPTNGNPPAPPHVRPNAQPTGNERLPALPPLDSNQEKVRKERGWSHARAAFANGLITKTDYLKHEPQAKIPEGM